jgi:putative DNA methylase
LSDFFFAWQKYNLKSVYPNIFGVLATPKSEELVATPLSSRRHPSGGIFFLEGMSRAIKNGGPIIQSRCTNDDLLCI